MRRPVQRRPSIPLLLRLPRPSIDHMNEPVRHHYLAQASHLRFFAIPGTADRVYLYRRGSEPREVAIRNVGAENNLYSLQDNSGGRHQDLEREVLAGLDGHAQPLMAKLNGVPAPSLSPDEFDTLYEFVTLQLVRTPAFRHTLREYDRSILQRTDEDLGMGEQLRSLLPTASAEVINSHIASARAAVQAMVEHPNYWLTRVGRFAEITYPVLRAKCVDLLVAESQPIVTSDHPVAMDYGLGLSNSNLVFPIGARRVLRFRPPTSGPGLGTSTFLPVVRISGAQARELNKTTIAHADSCVIASVKSDAVRRLFDATSRPARMQYKGPPRLRRPS